MPKVSTFKLNVGEHSHEYDIWFSKKEGFYAKGFPQEILTIVGFDDGNMGVTGFATLASLEEKIRSLLRDYYEKIKKTKKVIIYTITFSQDYRMKRTGLGHYQGTNPAFRIPKPFDERNSTTHTPNGYGLAFDWCIATEVKGKNTEYIREFKDEYGNIEKERFAHSKDRDEAVIDWTPEREAFFESMKEAMDKFATKFCEFFGKDEKELLAIMDNGTKLLTE